MCWHNNHKANYRNSTTEIHQIPNKQKDIEQKKKKITSKKSTNNNNIVVESNYLFLNILTVQFPSISLLILSAWRQLPTPLERNNTTQILHNLSSSSCSNLYFKIL